MPDVRHIRVLSSVRAGASRPAYFRAAEYRKSSVSRKHYTIRRARVQTKERRTGAKHFPARQQNFVRHAQIKPLDFVRMFTHRLRHSGFSTNMPSSSTVTAVKPISRSSASVSSKRKRTASVQCASAFTVTRAPLFRRASSRKREGYGSPQ